MQQGCKQITAVKKITVQTIISAEENVSPSHSECFLGLHCCFCYYPVSRSFEGEAEGHRVGRSEHPFCKVKRLF